MNGEESRYSHHIYHSIGKTSEGTIDNSVMKLFMPFFRHISLLINRQLSGN